ncbi:PD-(D/E)XK nuclease family transposase [Clostridium gasigenes]|nr:PD-(D/E)XK nuclease family transposase [Clostridium gasigenes]
METPPGKQDLTGTSNDEIINIEIQLKDEKNMMKRSMYYSFRAGY